VSDDVISRPEEICNVVSVLLEIDPLDWRIGRKTGTVEDQELESLTERKLRPPGRTPTDDASVDEHEPLHGRILAV
jgi:hypothetical protein